ncbi:MAG: ribosomal RNA small subunit methyltransferase A, partial [Candidatus Dadabacteria bacterium]|nr:ribosomal RNA small subunit methyltransferase A [Candidatus Dadabacteria bacterium]
MCPPGISDELGKLGVRPSRGMGQNFLVDGRIADWIVAQADISRNETVLEIGPGMGILTQRIA